MPRDLRRLADLLAVLHATAAVVAVGVLVVAAPRLVGDGDAAGLAAGVGIVASLFVCGCVAALRASRPAARTAAAVASGAWSFLLARAVISDAGGLPAGAVGWALCSAAWVALVVVVQVREVRSGPVEVLT